MGGIFVANTSQMTTHGVYGIETSVPALAQQSGTAVTAIVGQFPWGPVGVVTDINSPGDLVRLFSPVGMSRSSTGYLAASRKPFARLKVVRVLSSTAVAAFKALSNAVPTVITTVTLKSKGVAGNGVTVTVANPSDGDANHFKLTVTVTDTFGATSESWDNVNLSGVGADTVFDLSSAALVGSIVKNAAGRPVNGTFSFAGGTDGTAITAADYSGTPTAGDLGLAALENDASIRHVFVDDCGASIRAAVNAAIMAHVDSMGDRQGYIDGPSGETQAAAKTNVASYRSQNVVYCVPWVQQLDDSGNTISVPPSSYVAALTASKSPSTSPAIKDVASARVLANIRGVVTNYGIGRADLSLNGIAVLFREDTGEFHLEDGVNTLAPIDAARKNITRTRMLMMIVSDLRSLLKTYTDAPNIQELWDQIYQVTYDYLKPLLDNKRKDFINLPFVENFLIEPMSSVNTEQTAAQGLCFVSIKVKTAQDARWIPILAQVGPTVSIKEVA